MNRGPVLLGAFFLSTQIVLLASFFSYRTGGVSLQRPQISHKPACRGSEKNGHGIASLSDACAYFYSAEKFEDLCNASRAIQLSAEATLEGGCVPRPLDEPNELRFHIWTVNVPWGDSDKMRWILLMLKSWVITQDLRQSHLTFWTSKEDFDGFKAANISVFQRLKPYIEMKVFNYEEEVKGTPLALSKNWRDGQNLAKSVGPQAALNAEPSVPMSDVVRSVLLYNYGGAWLDTDALPLRDLWNISVGVGMQLIPKWGGSNWGGDLGFSNSHFMWVDRPKSALARRRLTQMLAFPFEYQDAWPVQPQTGLKSWVYNDAVPAIVRADQAQLYNLSDGASAVRNPTALRPEDWDNLEVPYPLGWFDPIWPCEKDLYENFKEAVACSGFFIWHRLNKPKDRPNDADHLGMPQLWEEIESIFDQGYPLEPRALTGGVDCFDR